MTTWMLSSSSDPVALSIVDGTGRWDGRGPHYSRRTPGSKTFTGCGREVVLITRSGDAVWAVVYQRTPHPRGSGQSRDRAGGYTATRYVWRNNMFRNLSPLRSSDLIREAVRVTYAEWLRRYGELPDETLRTEIDPRRVASPNPGYCYMCAGWRNRHLVRGKYYLYAPERGDQ